MKVVRSAVVGSILMMAVSACSAGGARENWLLGSWVLKGNTAGCKPWYSFAAKSETHDFYGQAKTIDVTYAVTSKYPDDIGVMGNLGNGFTFHRLGPNEMKGDGGCVYTRK